MKTLALKGLTKPENPGNLCLSNNMNINIHISGTETRQRFGMVVILDLPKHLRLLKFGFRCGKYVANYVNFHNLQGDDKSDDFKELWKSS